MTILVRQTTYLITLPDRSSASETCQKDERVVFCATPLRSTDLILLVRLICTFLRRRLRPASGQADRMSWKNPGHCPQATHPSNEAAGHEGLLSLIAQSFFRLEAPPGGLISLFSHKVDSFSRHPPRVKGAHPATTNSPKPGDRLIKNPGVSLTIPVVRAKIRGSGTRQEFSHPTSRGLPDSPAQAPRDVHRSFASAT